MQNYQTTLFPYAYNVLGSSDEAKDAIQEVMTKYLQTDTKVKNEKNYLIRAVINQSINVKKRQQRKTSFEDVWLPEPLETTEADKHVIMKDVLSYSLLLLLEQLNPKERAVFILNEAFAYSHKEIAEVLTISVSNSRKLLSRARSKIQKEQIEPEEILPSNEQQEQVKKYMKAIQSRDTKTLQTMLSDDVTFYADGGRDANVVTKFCAGNSDVSELMIFIHQKLQTSLTVRFAEINHQPAVLFYDGSSIKACQIYTFNGQEQRIQQICTIIDPVKLKNISPF